MLSYIDAVVSLAHCFVLEDFLKNPDKNTHSHCSICCVVTFLY